MRGAELVRRYAFTTGWNEETLLGLLIDTLDERGMLADVVISLDTLADEEMEAYAEFGEESE